MVSKAHTVWPHFCPCMALIHAIRHADRLATARRSLAVAAFAVYVQIKPLSLTSELSAVLDAELLRNSPCRQARELRSLAVAAFAVCVHVNFDLLTCKHAAALGFHVRAWLIANTQNATTQ